MAKRLQLTKNVTPIGFDNEVTAECYVLKSLWITGIRRFILHRLLYEGACHLSDIVREANNICFFGI